jgi:hypothetical protein
VPKVIWAIPGFIIWAVLQVTAMRWLTGRRGDKSGYGFVVLAPLIFYIGDALSGSTHGAEFNGALLVAGFPVAAIYLVVLLILEIADRKKLRADS